MYLCHRVKIVFNKCRKEGFLKRIYSIGYIFMCCLLNLQSPVASYICPEAFAGVFPDYDVPFLEHITGAAVVGEPVVDLVHPA